mmetsp:Transcript_1507/g.2245  ORF Transcript_1507/g.2245 Transcript_1507/m.2245 type:complete len:83 (-) Transcript_1507:55-303(-)
MQRLGPRNSFGVGAGGLSAINLPRYEQDTSKMWSLLVLCCVDSVVVASTPRACHDNSTHVSETVSSRETVRSWFHNLLSFRT